MKLKSDPIFFVQLCYAQDTQQECIKIECQLGWTIAQVIQASGIASRCVFDWEVQRVGVFGKLKKLDDPVRAGDRIEIYRPLTADPKEARRQRARQASRRNGP